MSNLLTVFPAIAAIVSFFVLSLAFVHEMAFYSVVGEKFQSLMGVTDYFSSAISWLPWGVFGFAIATVFHLTDPTRNVPENIKREFYKQHRIRWIWDRSPLWLVTTMVITLGSLQILFGDWYTRGMIELLLFFLWVRIFVYLMRQKNFADALTNEFRYVLLFAPAFLFSAYIGGQAEGAAALSAKEPLYYVKVKGTDRDAEWYVLRVLASGVIARDIADPNRLFFSKWDHIETFGYPVKQPNRAGLVCRITGNFCNFRIP
jgi:hypothetical protein